MRKPLPIGISDFKKVIEEGYTYVDKSLFIQELIEKGGEVSLIPRMRRFGKTLNLSMLRYFFEKREKETEYLFTHLKIWQNEHYRKMQGQYPVIFLTLKDVKYSNWEETFSALSEVIAEEFRRHRALLQSPLLESDERETFKTLMRREGDGTLWANSLLLLSRWLHRVYQKKVILLIDEYDSPAHASFVAGYFDKMVEFLRNWLSAGLKDNPSLERGVLTGILRIAKESIFSGLNNVSTFSLVSEEFSDKFGLLESEVKSLLSEYGLSDKLPEMRKWYNGYRIASQEGLYNPWSVLTSIKKGGTVAPYWVNTSDNVLIKNILTQGGEELKSQMEPLLKGEVLKKPLKEGLVFDELKYDVDAVWSLFLFCGYLTLKNTPYFDKGFQCELVIPNIEVRYLFEDIIESWFVQSINKTNFHLLLQSLTQGDIKTFSEIFQELVRSSMSVHDIPQDEPERVYHAFVLGLLVALKDEYDVRSNRESGYGRYDVCLIPKNKEKLGIVLEFKKVKEGSLEEGANLALKQIEEKLYADELRAQGIKKILHIGLAFRGKEVGIKAH